MTLVALRQHRGVDGRCPWSPPSRRRKKIKELVKKLATEKKYAKLVGVGRMESPMSPDATRHVPEGVDRIEPRRLSAGKN